MTRITNTEQFIEKAKQIHENKYFYLKTIYVKSKQDVKILCLLHGEFEQRPDHHLKGHGCKKCANDLTTKDADQFIKDSIHIHGNVFDYSKTKYQNSRTKVIIICKIHGEFTQLAQSHLSGDGCMKCTNDTKRKSLDTFIKESKQIHGDDIYTYDKVKYVNWETEVELVCKKHGSFWQKPGLHTSYKHGCQKCNMSHGERAIMVFLDAYNIKYEIEYKINKTSDEDSHNSYEGFDDIKPLRFDFYLPDYFQFLEYDGIQHFESFDIFGGEEGFIDLQRRDAIKNLFCSCNKLNLLRIPYWEEKNIDKILKTQLKI